VSETRAQGRLAVIAPQELHTALLARLPAAAHGSAPDLTRPVVLITPRQAKGLEFDTVIVAEPQLIVAGSARGSSDLYVALPRATQRLGMVYTGELPEGLAP
jgi:superfamily I DNA/RNA helicase